MNIATHRLHHQGLLGPAFEAPEAVVRGFGAVQAQDYHGAKWALALRTDGVDNDTLDRAFNSGTVLRTHVMRPTWHFVAPEDLRWLLALTGPRVHKMNALYYRRLELDEVTLRRGHTLLADTLQGGHHRTRKDLAGILETGGIPASGQRLAYILMHAELEGLICSGPLHGKQFTYALIEERVPPAPPLQRDEALAELTRRYFARHGPATVHDFVWWSGLTVSDARRGLELIGSAVECVTIDGTTYYTAPPLTPIELEQPVVHLLPNYDEHVVAYKDHGPTLDSEALEALRTRIDGPLNAHLITRNGLIVGGWRRTLKNTSVLVEIDLLVPLTPAERSALEQAADDYSRFIGLPAVLNEI